MSFILIPEIVESTQYRVRSGLSEPAEGGGFDVFAQPFQKFDISLSALALGNPLEDFEEPLCAYPAGYAFSARLELGKCEELFCNIDHAIVLIEDDHTA